jgi:hypothetical protein
MVVLSIRLCFSQTHRHTGQAESAGAGSLVEHAQTLLTWGPATPDHNEPSLDSRGQENRDPIQCGKDGISFAEYEDVESEAIWSPPQPRIPSPEYPSRPAFASRYDQELDKLADNGISYAEYEDVETLAIASARRPMQLSDHDDTNFEEHYQDLRRDMAGLDGECGGDVISDDGLRSPVSNVPSDDGLRSPVSSVPSSEDEVVRTGQDLSFQTARLTSAYRFRPPWTSKKAAVLSACSLPVME